MSKLRLYGSTSGYKDLVVPAVSDNAEVNIGNFVSNNFFQDNKSDGPAVTAVHPSTGIFMGDTLYVDGSNLGIAGNAANLTFFDSTGYQYTVRKTERTVNSNSNTTITVPFMGENGYFGNLSGIGLRYTNMNTGLSNTVFNVFTPVANTGTLQGQSTGYFISETIIAGFAFASEVLAGNIGDSNRGGGTSQGKNGATSETHAYYATNQSPNSILKFGLISNTPTATVGNLSAVPINNTNEGSSSLNQARGFFSGRNSPNSKIDRFSFTSDGNATEVGDLLGQHQRAAGSSSTTHGYVAGGEDSTTGEVTIQKYSHSTDGNSTDVADLTSGRNDVGGGSSSTHGYAHGGQQPSTSNVIDKYSHSSDANATDVGDLTSSAGMGPGPCSTSHIYVLPYSDASTNGVEYSEIIRYSTVSDGNAVSLGNGSVNLNPAGTRYRENSAHQL